MKLSEIVSPKVEPVPPKTFGYDGAADGALLNVTLRYVSPSATEDEVDRERTRVLGTQHRFNRLVDAEQQNKLLEDVVRRILAGRVLKIADAAGGPVTPRLLRSFLPLNVDAVAQGGGADEPFAFDTEAGDEAKKAEAAGNVLYLISNNRKFERWLTEVSQDVSYFQDADWESQLKNSETGSATS